MLKCRPAIEALAASSDASKTFKKAAEGIDYVHLELIVELLKGPVEIFARLGSDSMATGAFAHAAIDTVLCDVGLSLQRVVERDSMSGTELAGKLLLALNNCFEAVRHDANYLSALLYNPMLSRSDRSAGVDEVAGKVRARELASRLFARSSLASLPAAVRDAIVREGARDAATNGASVGGEATSICRQCGRRSPDRASPR